MLRESRCGICGCRLNTADVSTLDCGGDCMRCMAEAGDPDCIRTMHQLEPDNPKWRVSDEH